MKFGVREIANVVFKAKTTQHIGPYTFNPGQPVFYMDSAKTSTLEGAATTVYAQGGRGNTRLVTWEGEKTLTFTVEDALLSPVSFAMLSGAGLLKGKNQTDLVHFHQTTAATIGKGTPSGGQTPAEIDLTDALDGTDEICQTAPIFVVAIDTDGDLKGMLETTDWTVTVRGDHTLLTTENFKDGDVASVMVDYYVLKKKAAVSELQIDAENFAGNYYVEADTLFRRQNDGKDLPANITLPNVKIQSNFTFTMASTGDPSTFTFTMDAMPGYTYFDRTKKVLCAIQIVEEITEKENAEIKSIFPHPAGIKIDESEEDSATGYDEQSGSDQLKIRLRINPADGTTVTVVRNQKQLGDYAELAVGDVLTITPSTGASVTVNDEALTDTTYTVKSTDTQVVVETVQD